MAHILSHNCKNTCNLALYSRTRKPDEYKSVAAHRETARWEENIVFLEFTLSVLFHSGPQISTTVFFEVLYHTLISVKKLEKERTRECYNRV